jgi:hypothetical protein
MATPTIPTIPASASLYTVWQRTVYTERRLQRNKLTVDLAPPFAVLASRCKTELIAQLDHWGAEIGAQAAVDEADDALDDTTNEIVAEVKHLDRKTNNARLKRYLGKSTGSGVVRLGLASQLKVMRTWPGALASEPEASLKSLGERLAGLLSRMNAGPVRAAMRAPSTRAFLLPRLPRLMLAFDYYASLDAANHARAVAEATAAREAAARAGGLVLAATSARPTAPTRARGRCSRRRAPRTARRRAASRAAAPSPPQCAARGSCT